MELLPRVYRQKLVKAGDYLELYDYENPIKINQKNKKRKSYKKNKQRKPKTYFDDEEYEQALKNDFSLRRTKSNIVRLINSNADLKVFITLTFDSKKFDKSFTDFAECNLIFSNFIKRLKRKYPTLKYLAVPEFQGDYYYRTGIKKEHGGNIHYHLLSNLSFIESKELEEIWSYGFIKINNIRYVSAIGPYVAKYIGKELFDGRLFGKKKLFYSRSLNRPEIIITAVKVKNYLNSLTSPLKLLSEKTYRDDYVGRVRYQLYKQG